MTTAPSGPHWIVVAGQRGMSPRKPVRPQRVFSWNARVARRPSLVVTALRIFIGVTRPDVIVLTEANAYLPALRKRFKNDWVAYRKHSDVVVMVRKDMRQPTVTPIGHDTAWRGPHEGKEHRGRRWLMLDWPDLRLIALHRVPGGPSGGTSPRLAGRNRPAWEAEAFLLATAIGDTRPVLIVGDQNARLSEMRDFMARHDLRPVPTGAKVDWAMRRGVRASGRRLGRRGSDHPAVVYVAR